MRERPWYAWGVTGLLLILGAFLGGLALVAFAKVKDTGATLGWALRGMDRSLRLVGAICLLPGAAAMAWLIHRGLDVRASFLIGILAAFGLFFVSLAALRMEGALIENTFDKELRAARREPPRSTTVGQLVAAAIGIAAIATALYAVLWAP